jgi:hypothetical protein
MRATSIMVFAGRTPRGQVAYCKEEALPHVQAVPSAGSLDAHERGTRTAGYRNREDQSVILQPVRLMSALPFRPVEWLM